MQQLPPHHQKMLAKYTDHLERLRVCVEHNYEIIKLVTADVATLFENVKHESDQVPQTSGAGDEWFSYFF